MTLESAAFIIINLISYFQK